MATYDYSDTQVQFQGLQQRMQEQQERQQQNLSAASKIGTNAWKAWSGAQKSDMAHAMGMKDASGNPMFEMSEDYMKANPLKRIFTPSSGRVQLTESGASAQNVAEARVKGGDIYKQGLKDNPWLTEADDWGETAVSGKDIAASGKSAAEGAKDLGKITKFTEGPKTLGQDVKGMGKDMWGGLKSPGGSEFGGKALGAAGLLYGAGTLAKDWKKLSGKQKAGRGLALGLSTAAMFVPGLQPLSLLGGLGSSLIK